MKTTLPTPPKPTIDWERLIQKVIRRADEIGDSRSASLKMAASKGRSQQVLRTLSIIGDEDIMREFPDPK